MRPLFILLLCFPLFSLAQDKTLVVEGVSPDLFLSHTVGPKENLYSIGRLYNISPKEVAPYNSLVLENGLSLGQVVKIPLTAANFVQILNVTSDEALVPVYHSVEGKEGLYRISTNYNKLPVETLKKWNNLKGDAVGNGDKLIVGYLKVKKALSSFAGSNDVKPSAATTAVVVNSTVASKEQPAKQAPGAPVANDAAKAIPAPPVAEKVKKLPESEPVAIEPEPGKKSPAAKKTFNGGLFRSDFEKQTRDGDIAGETGEAAVFKSTSGWNDGKYYCLHNSSTPGTIVKITNKANGKSVYAKVLDTIPDIEQNSGLLVRVSNAAAEELGVGEGKFGCSLSYLK